MWFMASSAEPPRSTPLGSITYIKIHMIVILA